MSKKTKCLFCNSYKCYERVVRFEAPEYDELGCRKHVNELHNHVDEKLGIKNGVGRHYISSTGTLSRN